MGVIEAVGMSVIVVCVFCVIALIVIAMEVGSGD